MERVLWTLIVVVLVGASAALAVIYGGLFNVAASDPHNPVVRWAFDTTFKNSVERRAEDVAAPELDDPELVRQGARRYARMCITCHGVPGEPLPDMAKHMRPEPPHLGEAALEWGPAEVFWIVKHGVKMTGMPAWGGFTSDEHLWQIVAFVDRLPEITKQEYQNLIADQPQPAGAEPAKTSAAGEAGEAARAGGADQAAEAQAGETAQQTQTAGTEQDQTQAAGQQKGAGEPAALVEMTGALSFVPAQVTIKAGETVKWTNVSQVAHTVTADADKANDPQHVRLPEGAEPFDSGFIGPGETYSRRFTVPGRYKYFCIPHESLGMIGELVVEE